MTSTRKFIRYWASSLWTFAYKQAWSALFGILMLTAISFTAYVHLPVLSRYDWLFIIAICIQAFMFFTKLEKLHEVITIIQFHLVGLGMELFKTSDQIASWQYPGSAIFQLGNVPLFSGFMYAAVGSYIARAWRVFELEFVNYPNRFATVALAFAIYANFFTHHFVFDLRYVLFAGVVVLYGRTWVKYRVNQTIRRMPLILSFFLIAVFILIAENISTYTRTWLYPSQLIRWRPVSIHKLGSWLLLMIISVIMVDIMYHTRAKWANRSKLSQRTYPSELKAAKITKSQSK
jgi:uncharacterized membrane protein YoaT (DUF817 family)